MHSHSASLYFLLVCSLCGLCSACTPNSEPLERTRVAHQGLISSALSPNGQYLFTGSYQHGGALWDHAGERLYNWNKETNSFSAYIASDFSEDSKFLAATDGEAATIWNAETGKVALHLKSPSQTLAIQNTGDIWQGTEANAYWRKPGRILDIEFSQQYLLLALENQVVLLVDSTKRSLIGALRHGDAVTSIAMNDQATRAITGARNGEAYLWDLNDGQAILDLTQERAITFVAMSPSGRQAIVAAFQGPVLLLDANQETTVLFDGNPGVTAARFNENETELLIGTSRQQIRLVNLLNKETTARWTIPKEDAWRGATVIDVAVTQNGYQAIGSDGFSYRF